MLSYRYLQIRLAKGFELVKRRTTVRSSARAVNEVMSREEERIFSFWTLHWMSASLLGSWNAGPGWTTEVVHRCRGGLKEGVAIVFKGFFFRSLARRA